MPLSTWEVVIFLLAMAPLKVSDARDSVLFILTMGKLE